MGKSTILSEQKSVWEKEQNNSSEKYLSINLHSYQTDSRLATDLFESSTFKEWLTSTHTLHLFLDSLDEGLLSIKVLAAYLADEFKKLPSERLYLRIACRTVEWPDLLERALEDWLGKDVVEYYVLAPLRKNDVQEAAQASGLNGEHFLNQVESSAVTPFAIKPVTLNFLLSVYQKQGSLPSSQTDLYLKGCQLLASETSKSRSAAGYTGKLSEKQRLTVAARIAACMIFGNRNAAYIGMNSFEAPNEDVTIPELLGGNESDNGISFDIGEKVIRETLGTGLFSISGPNRIGWGHQTYAEFLAAWYLQKHHVSISQIKSLITHPDDPTSKIIPQLSETAAWLAGMIPEIFQAIVRAEPDLLLRSEVATGDSSRRAILVEALLQLYESNHVFDRDREHYQNLSHPGLADQLRPYVADKTKGIIVRRVAIDIAESCNTQSLNDVLLAVALDTSDNLQARVQAASAIGKIGDHETRERLKPLAFLDEVDDIQDELKGSVLRALWPSNIEAKELFPLLKPRKSESFFGAYEFFISSELMKDLGTQDLVPALEFVTGLPQARHEMNLSLESLMDGIVMKAWENMYEPGVQEALAKFAVSRLLKQHDHLIKGQLGKNEHLIFLQDEDKRHRLLEAVFQVVAQTPETKAQWLLFTHTPLVLPEDFEWLLSCLNLKPAMEVQVVIINLIERLFNRTPEHLEAIYEASKRHQILADKFTWVWEPIFLGSEEAQKMKASYEEQQEWTSIRRERPNLTPSPVERVIAALEKCETNDSAELWRLHRELSLEADATNYDRFLEWDILKMPGWISADQTIQERIVMATEKFILSQAPDSAELLVTGQWKTSDLSSYSALAFLLKRRPEFLQTLTSSQLERWCPIIVSFPFLNNDTARAVRDELLKIAYQKSPFAVLEVAKFLIDKELKTGERISTATELNAIWDNQIAGFFLQYAKSNETQPKSMGSLLSVLIAHDNTEARSFSESLLSLPTPQTDPERARAIIAAQTLILDTHDAGWATAWPTIQQDEDFGKEVILGICNDYASIGLRLNEDQLANLYVFLRRHFETPQHPSGEAYHCEPLDYVDKWRNAIIQLLIHRGSVRACEAIKKLQQEFPESDWLKSVQVYAETETRRATWAPALPEDIVKLAADRKLRLVQSGAQLLQVLVESLERFQSLLQGETPEAQFLWDNVSKSDAKPKDENAFADYVKTHLDKDLKQRGIILNREVRIHRGQRTDIHVNAIIQSTSENLYDSITTIIECKGCWNSGLYDAMSDQLVGKYLKDNPCQHGLYLVGWFNCSNWSKGDCRKKQAEKLCPTLDNTRQKLTASARDLSTDMTRIKTIVLDTSLH
ncbi:MAG: hypothetical protein MRJ67_10910 [Nitrospirales bacterium]|nr:hypothetical protein [Nitrospirales bacterium]